MMDTTSSEDGSFGILPNPSSIVKGVPKDISMRVFWPIFLALEVWRAWHSIGKEDRCDWDWYLYDGWNESFEWSSTFVFKHFQHRVQFNYQLYDCPLGPCYYPATFVWLYAVIAWICKWSYWRAQLLGAMGLIGLHSCAAWLFSQTRMPRWMLLLAYPLFTYQSFYLAIGKVTNDVFSSLAIALCLVFLMKEKHTWGSLMYTVSVGIKMNNLFFGPPLLMWYLLRLPFGQVVQQFAMMGIYQVLSALPFLLTNWKSYLAMSFSFSRKFTWANNYAWKFLGEEFARCDGFAVFLLTCTVLCLGVLAWLLYTQLYHIGSPRRKREGRRNSRGIAGYRQEDVEAILSLFLLANAIGFAGSKGVHIQFLLWIQWTLPFLLWQPRILPLWLQCVLLFVYDEVYYVPLYDMLRVGRYDMNNSQVMALIHGWVLASSAWYLWKRRGVSAQFNKEI